MKDNNVELSVVAPMYNEGINIGDNIEKICDYVDELPITYELIIVNDGSTDNSYEIAKEQQKKYPYLKIVSYKNNRGRGYALRIGIRHSIGKYVITTESDLNWGTDILNRLYNTLKNSESDVIVASPYMQGGKLKNVPFKRALISSWGNMILRKAIKSNINTVTGMTRGYIGSSIRRLYLEEDGKEIHLEIISKAEIEGYRITEIPATLTWPKNKDKPKNSVRKSNFKMWNLIKSHLLFATNEAPILLFGGIGGLLIIIGLIILFNLSWVFFIKNEIIGDRIITILSMIFLLLSGSIIMLVSFLSYQIRDVRKEIVKLKQMIYEQK